MGLLGARKAVQFYKPVVSSGYTFADADAEAYVAAMSSQPDATRKGHIDDFFVTLKATVALSKFDAFWLMAAHDSQAAGLNAVDPTAGTYDLIPTNSPTFTADRGYTGNGSTSYCRTGVLLSATTAFLQDANHVSVYSLTTGAATTYEIGAREASATQLTGLAVRDATDDTRWGNSQSGGSVSFAASATGAGFYLSRRTASNATALYVDATSVATSVLISGLPCNNEVLIGATNTNGTPGLYSTRQIAFASIGSNLADGEITALNSALTTYLTAVGAI